MPVESSMFFLLFSVKRDLIKSQEVCLSKYQKAQFPFSHVDQWRISPAFQTIIKYSV